MIWISLGQLPGWQSSNGTAADLNRLASFLGLMAQSNSDQGPDQAPPEKDRRTGELFGRRIALITHSWAATLDHAKPASLTADTPASANGLPRRPVARTRGSRKRR